MPAAATNISQILNWPIDEGIAAQILAAGVPPYVPRSREDAPDRYALPLFVKGASEGHYHRLPVGGFEYDIFPGSIVGVELFCPRVSDVSTPEGAKVIAEAYDIMAEMALRVRYALRFNAGDQLNDRFPYHKLTNLVPLADVIGYDEERKIDRYELRWQCTAGIRPTAWPTAEAGYILPDPSALPVVAT